MSMKSCAICEYEFLDGEKVVAAMVTTYHAIPSSVNVAVGHPERCVEIVHYDCYDWTSQNDEEIA